jgi:hypothetical protein
MSEADLVTTLQEFLADYIERRDYFRTELAGVVPPTEDVPLILQLVYPSKAGDKIVVVFGLPPDLSARNPPAAVRKVAQESLDAAKAAHPELGKLAYEISFAN